MAPFFSIDYPFNSASLWASTSDDLQKLYRNPCTGAVTTRTACSVTGRGFLHNERIHQHAFFTSSSKGAIQELRSTHSKINHQVYINGVKHEDLSTLNTLGYSPLPLKTFVDYIRKIQDENVEIHKPVIFSVTGNGMMLVECYNLLARCHDPLLRPWERWAMEINLSCPNIIGAPPPAYSPKELANLLRHLVDGVKKLVLHEKIQLEKQSYNIDTVLARLKHWDIPIGIKLPPYTFANQFNDLVEVINHINAEIGGESSNIRGSDHHTSRDENFDSTRSKPVDRYNLDALPAISQPSICPMLLTKPSDLEIDATLALDLGETLTLEDALLQAPSAETHHELSRILKPPFPISFVTATNTLGSCLHLTYVGGEDAFLAWRATLNSSDELGLGGLAGACLHPLSLGNVKSLKSHLERHARTKDVKIIGVGGVSDAAGYCRMKAAGADSVALASALGAKGNQVFSEIVNCLSEDNMNSD